MQGHYQLENKFIYNAYFLGEFRSRFTASGIYRGQRKQQKYINTENSKDVLTDYIASYNSIMLLHVKDPTAVQCNSLFIKAGQKQSRT